MLPHQLMKEEYPEFFLNSPYRYFNLVVGDNASIGHNLNISVKTKKDIVKIVEGIELQKTVISKEKLIERIRSQANLIEKPEMTPEMMKLFTLDKEILLVKGTFYFWGDEYPYFAVLLQKEDVFLIEEFHKLLRVLLIDGKYYFVSWWQKPEAGGRGVIINRLENNVLVEAFADYSTAT